jgi:hypothetical protein
MIHPGHFFPLVVDTGGNARPYNGAKHLTILSGKILSGGKRDECLFQPLAVKSMQKSDPSVYPFF